MAPSRRIVAASRLHALPRRFLETSAPSIAVSDDGAHEYPFTAEHRQIQRSYTALIEKEVNGAPRPSCTTRA